MFREVLEVVTDLGLTGFDGRERGICIEQHDFVCLDPDLTFSTVRVCSITDAGGVGNTYRGGFAFWWWRYASR